MLENVGTDDAIKRSVHLRQHSFCRAEKDPIEPRSCRSGELWIDLHAPNLSALAASFDFCSQAPIRAPDIQKGSRPLRDESDDISAGAV